MERPRTWIFVVFITNLSFNVNTICQHVAAGNIVIRENRDCNTPPGNPTTSDIYNLVLPGAATNGIFPDLIPILQGQQITENLQRFPYPQDLISKQLSVIPTSGINSQDSLFISSQPIRSSAANPNVILTTALSSGCPSNTIPGIPQTISPTALPPPNCVSQIAQALPLENYPICAPNVGVLRPMPIVLQPQCQFNEVNPYNLYNQIADPIPQPDVNTKPLLPPSQNLPPINACFGTLETTPNLSSLCLPQSTLLTSDGQPLNFQFNVPPSNVPAPRVTVVSANPSNSPVPIPAPCCPDYPVPLPPYQYPPQPPIILESSKSSLQKWLPIILVALFSDRGCNDGCCCCCSCNGGSGNNIPIPYPIPIPVNNPIINCPYSSPSRNREGDDDDD